MTGAPPPSPSIKEALLCRERVVELLHYDQLTGDLSWRFGKRCGQRAGCRLKNGYITVCIDGHAYRAHRLAWLIIHGIWPANQIDHIDGRRSNNAILNLREATHSQNAFNRGEARGYSYHLRDKVYRAAITVNRKKISLGDFHSPEAAINAYRQAREKYAGDFAIPYRERAA